MGEDEAARLFHALSNADRLSIIRRLVVAGPQGLSAGDIAQGLGASASRASFHLAALAEAGFIHRQRQSRSLRYTVDYSSIAALVSFLTHDCCRDSPELRACRL
ncbi:MAG: metalloregulator ArsR/SmtB family transcription factor [Pseudomonadota bacterium]